MSVDDIFLQNLRDGISTLIDEFYADFKKGENDYLDSYDIEKNENNYLVFWLGITSGAVEGAYVNRYNKIPSRKDMNIIANVIKEFIPRVKKEYVTIKQSRF